MMGMKMIGLILMIVMMMDIVRMIGMRVAWIAMTMMDLITHLPTYLPTCDHPHIHVGSMQDGDGLGDTCATHTYDEDLSIHTIYLPNHLYYLSIYLSIHLSIYLIYLSIYTIYPSIYPFIQFIHSLIHPSIIISSSILSILTI